MANIVLTNKCNLNCSYCFAKAITNKKAEYFTHENFIKAINFIKTGNENRLGIVGGEPTVHPQFSDFINIINKDNQIQNCVIFTNGIELYNYIDILKPKKFSILINCNSPKNIRNSFTKLEKSIQCLEKINKENYSLGINIYSPHMDYSYIFDLLKISKQHTLRFSISINNMIKQNCNDVLKYLKYYNPLILNFYKDCTKNEIIPHFDCSNIPFCIMDLNLKTAQLKIVELQKKYNDNYKILGNQCSLQIDIFSDLTAVRSICYPYYKKVSISDFKSINSLRNYFYNEIDCYNKLLFISDKCKNCNYRLLGQCNICPCYTINQFQEFKNYVLNKETRVV